MENFKHFLLISTNKKSIQNLLPLFILFFFSSFSFSQSTVETHSFFSPALGVNKSFLIYLPDGYDENPDLSYPTVYFCRLHETEWFNPDRRVDDETLKSYADEMIENGIIGKMILVGPSTGGNTQDNNWGAGGIVNLLRPDLAQDEGIGTGAFEDYFINDLILYVDENFRTIPEWCGRGIDGYSLGGYASTLYGLKHPGVFSSVGCFDGTLMFYNNDNPFFDGTFDDGWTNPNNPFFTALFGSPLDSNYMRANNASNILADADSIKLDSFRQMTFHLTSAIFGNWNTNSTFAQSLASRGINNTFDELLLSPTANHNFDSADEHAKLSLIKHWESFVTNCGLITSASTLENNNSGKVKLYQAIPNPVTSVALIQFETSINQKMDIDLFDSHGKLITRILSGEFTSGKHQIQLDLSDYPNGVYYYRLINGDQFKTRRLLLLKNQ